MKQKEDTIVYIGAFRFPDKDAAAKRVLGVGYALRDSGYRVVYAGGEQGSTDRNQIFGFDYYSQNELDLNSPNIFLKMLNFFRAGLNTVRWLCEFQKQNEIHKIILYNSSNIFIRRIARFCRKNNIELIPDITEWYQSSHLPGGRYGLISLDNALKMKFTYYRFNKMIVISKFLKHNFKDKSRQICLVPPVIYEGIDLTPSKSDNSALNLLYAGSPGLKDDLFKIVKLIQENSNQFSKIQLTIAGITQKQFERMNDITVEAINICFMGRVSQEVILDLYRNAHFSFIIRPNERYANAGFPTKFVESLKYGVPIIATNTSDLGDYLVNEVNGYLLKSSDVLEIKETLTKILNINDSDMIGLKNNALKTAAQFEYNNYTTRLSEFIVF